jgi:hypothetical protein
MQYYVAFFSLQTGSDTDLTLIGEKITGKTLNRIIGRVANQVRNPTNPMDGDAPFCTVTSNSPTGLQRVVTSSRDERNAAAEQRNRKNVHPVNHCEGQAF